MRQLLRAIYHRHVKPRYVRYRLSRRQPEFDLEFHGAGIGFFAQLTACLHFYRHAEARGFSPFVKLSSSNYLDSDLGDDWFAYYFDHLKPRREEAGRRRRALRIGNIGEMPEFDRDLSLADANRLFFGTVRIKPEIVGAVDGFCRTNAVGGSTLGVHYRGTDKSQEATPPGYAEVYAIIDEVLARNPAMDTLFVASDEHGFIEGVASQFRGLRVVTFDDAVRSRDGTPVHLGGKASGNYRIGLDALMNALILSRCGALVRSTSFLSAWSSILNPGIPVFLVNTPYAHKLWFPEREIMKTAVLARDLLPRDLLP